MRRQVVAVFLVVVLGMLGCRFFGEHGPDANTVQVATPVSTDPIRTTGNASLVVAFKIPGKPIMPAVEILPDGAGKLAQQGAILADPTDGEIRVSFILRLIHPGHPEKPFTELKREVPVVGGVATITFSGLPPESTIGTVNIIGGKKEGYSDFHGGVDLVETATNTLVVAPIGSSEDAAQVAQVIKNMLEKPEDFKLIKPKVVTSMGTALYEGRNRVGTESAKLLDNVRSLYLAQTASSTSDLTQEKEGMREFMISYSTNKDRIYEGQSVAVASAPTGSIRAGIRSWTWKELGRYWELTIPGQTASRTFRLAFQAGPSGSRFPYITDSPLMDRVVTQSRFQYVSSNGQSVSWEENNQFVFLPNLQSGNPVFDFLGEMHAYVGTKEIYNIYAYLRYCDVRAKYPGIGWIGIYVYPNENYPTGRRTRFFFDGTCVSRIVIGNDSSVSDGYEEIPIASESAPGATSVLDPPPSGPPTDVRATATHSSFIISWSPASGATTYDLYYSDRPGLLTDDCGWVSNVSSPYLHPGEIPIATPTYLRIVGRSSGGESPPSTEVVVKPLPPFAPTGAKAQPGNGNILFSWDRVIFSPTLSNSYFEYLVWFASHPIDLNDPSSASQVQTRANSYRVDEVTEGQTWYFSVQAISPKTQWINGTPKGLSSPTPLIQCSLATNPPPRPPPDVQGQAATDGAIIVWQTVPEAVEYKVYQGSTAGFTKETAEKSYNVNSSFWKTPESYPKGTNLFLAVTTLTNSQESEFSRLFSVRVPGNPAPANFRVTPRDGRNLISWNQVDGAIAYNLYWSNSPDVSPTNGNKIAGVTSPFIHADITNQTRFYYIVTAIAPGSLWESDPSVVLSGIPRPPVIPPPPLSASATVDPSGTGTLVNWTNMDYAATYTIYWGTTPGVGKTSPNKVTGLEAGPYHHENLTLGTTYYYVVTGWGAEGESGISSEAHARIELPPPPAAPTGVRVSNDGSTNVISWTAVSGALSYNVYWGTASGSTSNKVPDVAGPSYSHADLSPNTTYYYVVTAVNAGGESSKSPQVGTTTPNVVLPSAPTGFSAIAGPSRNTLTWNQVSGATSYNLYWSTTTPCTKAGGVKIAGVSSPYVHKRLAAGTPLYYLVTAVNGNGESSASTQTGATPQALPTTSINLGNNVTMDFVQIPTGTFLMGSPESEEGRYSDETQHQVTITRPFWISKTEVTQEQWFMVMNNYPSYFSNPPSTAKYPVERVSWTSAATFCNYLSQGFARTLCYYDDVSGVACNWNANGFRLPTSAEWEYACRADSTTPFEWGSGTSPTTLDLYAWTELNSSTTTHQTGQLAPNFWGLHDMNGNVWEWCWDWYDAYSSSPETDPRGPSTAGTNRVCRGGSFYSGFVSGFPTRFRSGSRSWNPPTNYAAELGFRVVVTDGATSGLSGSFRRIR